MRLAFFVASLVGLAACSSHPPDRPSPEDAIDAKDAPPRKLDSADTQQDDAGATTPPPADSDAGAAGPNGLGGACGGPADCTTNLCIDKKCCELEPAAPQTTGPVSGTQQVCCDGTAIIAEVKDCATGMNHSATKVSAQCAQAKEGAGNNGTACAEITCVVTKCGP